LNLFKAGSTWNVLEECERRMDGVEVVGGGEKMEVGRVALFGCGKWSMMGLISWKE
jgi:hypothetical protein